MDTMNHKKKFVTFVSSLVLMMLVISPIFATTADAAAVLESPVAATANLGQSFEILARGRAGDLPAERSEFKAIYFTNMTLRFTIVARGERAVLLDVLGGRFSLNSTVFLFDEGIGFAARPERSDLNVTVVFRFKINMTGPDGVEAQLVLLGGVKRVPGRAPLLIMRGLVTVGSSAYVFRQLGRIHRIQP
ncbi:MAG: hypothetical protein ACTSV3_08670 [Candidatus Thorarchaeota archaeon]|nr:MAG: hypothetical protein DRP09_11870 [Candidatus Thorarchaeota archaeon]RLI59878.1 MAG: hypothetical protein DRO87_01640 [Candidatus Thorarchaeota archaeon]